MRWKQFFTPVKSFNADQARQLINIQSTDAVNILDVRQPSEYQAGHIPGLKLISLPAVILIVKRLSGARSPVP